MNEYHGIARKQFINVLLIHQRISSIHYKCISYSSVNITDYSMKNARLKMKTATCSIIHLYHAI